VSTSTYSNITAYDLAGFAVTTEAGGRKGKVVDTTTLCFQHEDICLAPPSQQVQLHTLAVQE